jgi:hypothetical protein
MIYMVWGSCFLNDPTRGNNKCGKNILCNEPCEESFEESYD